MRVRCRTNRVTFALLLCSAAIATGSDIDKVRAIMRDAKERRKIPSISVAVLRDGELVFNEAIGLANVEQKTNASRGSVYQLGSIGKQFTAAGVMRLVERGEIKLADRVSTFFPDAHPSWSEVRVSHLLQQTSGIREFFTIPEVGRALTDLSRPPDELLRYILREPLGFQPGERWAYSNSNYTLLGSIIEKVTGIPYEQHLAREFFERMELRSIHHCESEPTRADLAEGYSVRNGKFVRQAIENMNWARGDGGLCGNASDLVRWSRALAKGDVVTAESYEQMIEPARTADGIRPNYGYGLSVVPLDGRVAKIAHNGAIGGFMAALAYYPESDLAIAVLTNRSGIWPQVIEKKIARALLGLPAPDFRSKPLPREELMRYVGTYDIGVTNLPLRIVERGGQLRLDARPPIPSGELRYFGDGRFVTIDDPDAIEVQFFGSSNEPADRLELHMAAMDWYGRCVPDKK